MSRVNCTIDHHISGWVTAAVWEQVIICFIGSICNAVSIWCLSRCKRTSKAVKLQLICISSLQMATCIVTLPFINYLYSANFFCWEDKVPKQVQFVFSILNSMLLQGERLNFTVMAVYRVVAVCCPRQYKKMVTMKVVITFLFGIVVIIVPPWIALGILKGFDFSNTSGTVLRLHFENEGSFVMALYGIYYFLPIVITFVAYTIMMLAMIRQNRQVKLRTKKRSNNMDHVAFTIRIVILANLLLDGPHVIVHLLDVDELANIITHMAFFLHLVLDPIIFVGMNRNYRKEVLNKLRDCVYSISASVGQPSCPASDAGEALKDDNKDFRVTWRQAQNLSSDKRKAIYVT